MIHVIIVVVLAGLGLASELTADYRAYIDLDDARRFELRLENEQVMAQYKSLDNFIQKTFKKIYSDIQIDKNHAEIQVQLLVIKWIWQQPKGSWTHVRRMYRHTLNCFCTMIHITFMARSSTSASTIMSTKVRWSDLQRHVSQVLDAVEVDAGLLVRPLPADIDRKKTETFADVNEFVVETITRILYKLNIDRGHPVTKEVDAILESQMLLTEPADGMIESYEAIFKGYRKLVDLADVLQPPGTSQRPSADCIALCNEHLNFLSKRIAEILNALQNGIDPIGVLDLRFELQQQDIPHALTGQKAIELYEGMGFVDRTNLYSRRNCLLKL